MLLFSSPDSFKLPPLLMHNINTQIITCHTNSLSDFRNHHVAILHIFALTSVLSLANMVENF